VRTGLFTGVYILGLQLCTELDNLVLRTLLVCSSTFRQVYTIIHQDTLIKPRKEAMQKLSFKEFLLPTLSNIKKKSYGQYGLRERLNTYIYNWLRDLKASLRLVVNEYYIGSMNSYSLIHIFAQHLQAGCLWLPLR